MSKASVYFTVDRLSGEHNVKKLKRELDTLGGVSSVSVNEGDGNIAVDYDTSGVQQSEIQRMIEKLGYDIVGSRIEQHTM